MDYTNYPKQAVQSEFYDKNTGNKQQKMFTR